MKRRDLIGTAIGAAWLAAAPGALAAVAAPTRTGFVQDDRFLQPVFRPSHPEQPARVRVIVEALRNDGLLDRLVSVAPLPATEIDAALRLIHTEAHIAAIAGEYGAAIDGVARTGVGAVLAAVTGVMNGSLRNAFVCSRPPGHHASNTGREEGFCFYNNIAIAARYAQRHFGIERVLIVDWDYHHGNGTEAFFYDDPGVLYFSTHDWAAYPGTGDPQRRGEGPGLGYNINVPLRCRSTDDDIVGAFETQLLPAAERFQPELVLISAGFDSRVDDLLGCFAVTDAGFVRLTRLVMGIARRHSGGRLVSMLEGGYNLSGLASAAVAHVRTLAGGD
jgi:acetoin utilization deacetylase AcuC-like enzyme